MAILSPVSTREALPADPDDLLGQIADRTARVRETLPRLPPGIQKIAEGTFEMQSKILDDPAIRETLRYRKEELPPEAAPVIDELHASFQEWARTQLDTLNGLLAAAEAWQPELAL